MSSKEPEERFCASKINKIRGDIKKDRNAEEVARYRAVSGWADSVADPEAADKAFDRVLRWYTERGRHPSNSSKDLEERACAHRVGNIRQAIKKNRNPEEFARYRGIPGWTDSDESANKAFNRVVDWYAKHGQHPSSQSKDPEERFCGQKVSDIRKYVKAGRQPEITTRYQTIPGWADSAPKGPRK
jgi:hypothetical protein